jgi:hypothetical protein
MKEHMCSTGGMIAIYAFLLLLPAGWTQQPKPGGAPLCEGLWEFTRL